MILLPVYNDWAALELLLPRLDAELGRHGLEARVLLVDDGSLDVRPDHLTSGALEAIVDIRVLTLRRNVGHQRALAIGLAFVQERVPCSRHGRRQPT